MKLLRVLTVLLLGGTLMGSNDAFAATPAAKSADKAKAASAKGGEDVAVLKTSMGTIVFRFYDKDAPKHVANFKKLAGEKFYDGTTFHRVIPGFMIQGGDPNSKDDDRANDGLGGAASTVAAEFSTQKHLRGTVSMARANDPNSASSQFFICVKPTAFLDGKYSIFGQVLEGQDVVDKIVAVPRDARDNPLDKVVMEKVTIEKRKI
ncbi:MAG: peptidylprolyl isomerase [Candidatus Eisenbacteria bacterium]